MYVRILFCLQKCRVYRGCFVQDQGQFVLMYAQRSELKQLGNRDHTQEWAELFRNKHEQLLGLEFMEKEKRAVCTSTVPATVGSKQVTLYMKAGTKLLEDYPTLNNWITNPGT